MPNTSTSHCSWAGLPQVQGQPGLPKEFQARLTYIAKPYLKNQNYKNQIYMFKTMISIGNTLSAKKKKKKR